MDVCPRFSVLCFPVSVEDLRWTDPPQGVLPNVYTVEKSIKKSIGPQRTLEDHRKKLFSILLEI
jgi:hypothetical protein